MANAQSITGYETTNDMCCEPTCATYACKTTGWMKKAGSDGLTNPNDAHCCEATCASYTCATAGWVNKAGAADKTNPSDNVCCEEPALIAKLQRHWGSLGNSVFSLYQAV